MVTIALNAHQVQKITIIPRSNGAGGLTFFAPQESRLESGMYSRQYLESQLAVALGGRLAEELIYGEGKNCLLCRCLILPWLASTLEMN